MIDIGHNSSNEKFRQLEKTRAIDRDNAALLESIESILQRPNQHSSTIKSRPQRSFGSSKFSRT